MYRFVLLPEVSPTLPRTVQIGLPNLPKSSQQTPQQLAKHRPIHPKTCQQLPQQGLGDLQGLHEIMNYMQVFLTCPICVKDRRLTTRWFIQIRCRSVVRTYAEKPTLNKSDPGLPYAQTLILVKLIVVNIICCLVITRNPVGIPGPY